MIGAHLNRCLLAAAISGVVPVVAPERPRAYAAEVTGQEAKELFEYLWAGWAAERERLRSGRFRVQGTDTDYLGRSTPSELDLARPRGVAQIDTEVVFDWESGWTKHRINWGKFYKGVWLLGPDMAAVWPDAGGGVVVIQHPREERLAFARFVDPRIMGLVVSEQIRRSMTFEDVRTERAQAPPPLSVTKLGEGRFRVTWEKPSGGGQGWTLRDSVVINEDRGFSIEAREHQNVHHQQDKIVLLSRIQAKWDEIAGHWLPVSVETYNPMGLDALQITYEWSDVNQEIPADEFGLEDSGIPKGTLIADKRLSPGESVILGEIGSPGYVVQSSLPGKSGVRLGTYAIIGANVVLLVAIATFLVVRRRRMS